MRKTFVVIVGDASILETFIYDNPVYCLSTVFFFHNRTPIKSQDFPLGMCNYLFIESAR